MESENSTQRSVVRERLFKGNSDSREIAAGSADLSLAVFNMLKAIRRLAPTAIDDPELTLAETPDRVARFWNEWLLEDTEFTFASFPPKPGRAKPNGMIVERDCPVFSFCAHHILPYFGVTTLAYIPRDGWTVGLSKMPRLVRYCFSGLTTQEEATAQIADMFMSRANPAGCGVFTKCTHTCVSGRGVRAHGASTEVIELRGVFADKSVKAEFERRCGV